LPPCKGGALKAIKADPQLRSILVVVLTTFCGRRACERRSFSRAGGLSIDALQS